VQFMALIYGDERAWDSLSADEQRDVFDRYRALSSEAQAAGVLAGGSELGPSRNATTVKVRDGQTLVTDGPYAETKEILAGYYVFDCDSWSQALDWAARIPTVEYGAIEVRPVYVDEEAGS
jgi:hypothetical protein